MKLHQDGICNETRAREKPERSRREAGEKEREPLEEHRREAKSEPESEFGLHEFGFIAAGLECYKRALSDRISVGIEEIAPRRYHQMPLDNVRSAFHRTHRALWPGYGAISYH